MDLCNSVFPSLVPSQLYHPASKPFLCDPFVPTLWTLSCYLRIGSREYWAPFLFLFHTEQWWLCFNSHKWQHRLLLIINCSSKSIQSVFWKSSQSKSLPELLSCPNGEVCLWISQESKGPPLLNLAEEKPYDDLNQKVQVLMHYILWHIVMLWSRHKNGDRHNWHKQIPSESMLEDR